MALSYSKGFHLSFVHSQYENKRIWQALLMLVDGVIQHEAVYSSITTSRWGE